MQTRLAGQKASMPDVKTENKYTSYDAVLPGDKYTQNTTDAVITSISDSALTDLRFA